MDSGVHSFGVSVFGGGVVWFSLCGFFVCVCVYMAFPIMDRGCDDQGHLQLVC